FARGWTTNFGRSPGERVHLAVDGVFITHLHGDHWSLPSIMRSAPAADTPVVVPRVPAPSLLTTQDPIHSLRLTGQRVESRAWSSKVTVGDIEVDVLPFYGEQPVRDAPGLESPLRNWGNCYRFNAPEFSLLILVDSGVDWGGTMVEVIRRSTEE